jgi:hypothetical protein
MGFEGLWDLGVMGVLSEVVFGGLEVKKWSFQDKYG